MNGPLVEGKRRLKPGVLFAEQMVQRRAESVDIAARLRGSTILFRRGVPLRTDHRPFDTALKDLSNTKIHQPNSLVIVQHDVGRLQVTENHRMRVMVV